MASAALVRVGAHVDRPLVQHLEPLPRVLVDRDDSLLTSLCENAFRETFMLASS